MKARSGGCALPGSGRIKLLPDSASQFLSNTDSGTPLNPLTTKRSFLVDAARRQRSGVRLRQAAADLRSVMQAARENQVSLFRVVQQADSLMTKLQQGNGTLGMLATDSTLYRETTKTMVQFRELLTDIQQHPKKYLKISVF